MGFAVTCTPGRDAAAAYMPITPELPALVIYLDPVNFVIQLPNTSDGVQVLAKFCRELSREAAKLAEAIDPAGNGAVAAVPVADADGPQERVSPPGAEPD